MDTIDAGPPLAREPDLRIGDCVAVMRDMPGSSVHLIVTDPPYGLNDLDGGWDDARINGKPKSMAIGGRLPAGMKFDPRQGRRLQEFLTPVAAEVFRVLKPGAFALVFAQPRLAHRAASAVEDAGFEIRDLLAWRFTQRAQFKAFTQDHFVRRWAVPPEEKAEVIRLLGGRRTPQLRPQHESIVLAQKPREGTFVNNWLTYRTGLIDATEGVDGGVPHTVITVEKEQRAKFNGHLTVKPVALLEHLIKVFSAQGQIVLDPFVGSGSTCLAAHRSGRASIGIDINPDYIDKIARRRLAGEKWRQHMLSTPGR